MTQVKVSFLVEASDPGHETGVSNDDHEVIMEAIAQCGGINPDFEKVED